MLSPISSTHASPANEAAKAPNPQPQQAQQAQQKTAAQPSDTVKLKSTGDVNHDGDSK
jgi:hypothetical protein